MINFYYYKKLINNWIIVVYVFCVMLKEKREKVKRIFENFYVIWKNKMKKKEIEIIFEIVF